MSKEKYIKPVVKSEILKAEVLTQNWGSGGRYNGGNNFSGGNNWGGGRGFWWWCR